ncbi:hypothetical protein CCR95_14990 [Thiocystis minor]|nr:hypothetical protein [Thiocystis minor]
MRSHSRVARGLDPRSVSPGAAAAPALPLFARLSTVPGRSRLPVSPLAFAMRITLFIPRFQGRGECRLRHVLFAFELI